MRKPKLAVERREMQALCAMAAETLLQKRSERSLHSFLKMVWPVLEPGRSFTDNWHIHAMCAALEAVAEGRIRRLILSVPYRTSKSTLVGVVFPVWCWLRHPATRFLTGSHSQTLAVRDALRARRLLESPLLTTPWGDRLALAPDQYAKGRFENANTGYRIAFGVNSGVTGEGGDIIILDDPNTAEAMFSEAARAHTNEFYDQQLSTRLNDPEKSAVVIVQQRFHPEDLSGHLLEKGGWVNMRLPMMFEPSDPCVIPEIGFRDPRTQEGELMWPARFPQAWVEEQKRTLGTYGVAAQLQQRPAPAGGGLIRLDWFRRYKALPSRDQWLEVVQAWDTASKASELTNAPWVGGTWVRTETGYYLVRITRRWMTYPEGRRAVTSEYEWCSAHLAPPHAVLIEDKSTGSSLLQELGDQTSMPLLAVLPEKDKVTRLGIESPAIEAGNVWLPESAEWLSDFEREIANFPNASTADQGDCLSMSLKHFREGGASAGPRLRSL